MALLSWPGLRKCLRITNAAHQASASCFLLAVFFCLFVATKGQLLGVDVLWPVVGQIIKGGGSLLQPCLGLGVLLGEESPQPLALGLVALLQHHAGLLVVPFDGLEGVVGEAGGDEFGGCAEQSCCRRGCGGRGRRAVCRVPGLRATGLTLHSSTAIGLMSTP